MTQIGGDLCGAPLAHFRAVRRAPAPAGVRAAVGCDSALLRGLRVHRVVLSQGLRLCKDVHRRAGVISMHDVSETNVSVPRQGGRRDGGTL